MTAVNFTKKQNALTGGIPFFVSTFLQENKSTDLRAKIVPEIEPIIFGEAKSTNTRDMGFWTDGCTYARTHARTDGRTGGQTKSIKKGVGENARAFRLVESDENSFCLSDAALPIRFV